MIRREFVKNMGVSSIALMVVPNYTVSGLEHVPPSDKLNIAGIGIGGKAEVNLRNMVGQNIVSPFDVDYDYATPVFEEYSKAKKYKDFRIMLDLNHKS